MKGPTAVICKRIERDACGDLLLLLDAELHDEGRGKIATVRTGWRVIAVPVLGRVFVPLDPFEAGSGVWIEGRMSLKELAGRMGTAISDEEIETADTAHLTFLVQLAIRRLYEPARKLMAELEARAAEAAEGEAA